MSYILQFIDSARLMARSLSNLVNNLSEGVNNKTNNKCMNNYDKNKESSYLQYWNVNNLYGWAVPQKVPVNNFE